MNTKIIGISMVIAISIIFGSVLFAQQQVKSENEIQVYKEELRDVEWDNEVTRLLPKREVFEKEWNLMWSDSTEKFAYAEKPIIIRKTVAGNEVLSTSYSYSHKDYGTYQILIWKGDLVSNWNPRESIDNIFLQTDAKTEKVLGGLDLIPNCVVAYYDYYGDENEIKNDLLFSECAKEDFRIRINLIEGEYSQEVIEKLVFLSNLVVGKI